MNKTYRMRFCTSASSVNTNEDNYSMNSDSKKSCENEKTMSCEDIQRFCIAILRAQLAQYNVCIPPDADIACLKRMIRIEEQKQERRSRDSKGRKE